HVEAFRRLKAELDVTGTTLVAVSKLKSVADIRQLYDLGQRDFGENYVQELVEKQRQLPEDIRWHFIGHLQTNKVKYLAPFVHLIHSVDRFRLLEEINKQGARCGRQIGCLLQMHIAEETTKFGLDNRDLVTFMSYYEAQQQKLAHIQLNGMMGMASLSDDRDKVSAEFGELQSLFAFTQKSYFLGLSHFSVLS